MVKNLFKGNPNIQGILNWIIQILHYYCWKQHKNIENSRIIEQNVSIFLSLVLSLLTGTCPSFSFLNSRVFSSWSQFWTSKVIIRAVYSFFSALKRSFSTLSLAKYHCLHNKLYIFHVISNHRTSLQISLL